MEGRPAGNESREANWPGPLEPLVKLLLRAPLTDPLPVASEHTAIRPAPGNPPMPTSAPPQAPPPYQPVTAPPVGPPTAPPAPPGGPEPRRFMTATDFLDRRVRVGLVPEDRAAARAHMAGRGERALRALRLARGVRALA